MNIHKNSLAILLVLTGAFGTGCLGLKPTADPTKFYVLTSERGKGELKSSRNISVQLGRVDLASYVENPGIPVRKGENQIDYLQYYNWAEPIHAGIERTMRENLSEELGILVGRNSVARSSDENNFEVRINISRFELTDKNQAIVSGDWMILHGNGVRKGRVELRKNFPGSKTDAGPGVAALSGALSELCQQIAKEIQGQ